MARLLFKLHGVSAEEAAEVRVLLTDNQIDFYETSGGNWGVSVAALWLRDDSQYLQARELLDTYNEQRQVLVQEEYHQRLSKGRARFYWSELVRNPLRFILYTAIAAAVIYLSTIPFLNFSP